MGRPGNHGRRHSVGARPHPNSDHAQRRGTDHHCHLTDHVLVLLYSGGDRASARAARVPNNHHPPCPGRQWRERHGLSVPWLPNSGVDSWGGTDGRGRRGRRRLRRTWCPARGARRMRVPLDQARLRPDRRTAATGAPRAVPLRGSSCHWFGGVVMAGQSLRRSAPARRPSLRERCVNGDLEVGGESVCERDVEPGAGVGFGHRRSNVVSGERQIVELGVEVGEELADLADASLTTRTSRRPAASSSPWSAATAPGSRRWFGPRPASCR